MAKTTFAKLALKANTEIASFEENEQIVEVKQYLPIEDKMEMIARIINNSVDDNGYYNIGKVEMNLTLEIIFAYTNVTFTEKQKENLAKLYDVLYSSGFWNDVCACLPQVEFQWIRTVVYSTIDKIYEYKNSVYGVLDTISADYSNLNLNADIIREKLTAGENVEFLKDILTKLG